MTPFFLSVMTMAIDDNPPLKVNTPPLGECTAAMKRGHAIVKFLGHFHI